MRPIEEAKAVILSAWCLAKGFASVSASRAGSSTNSEQHGVRKYVVEQLQSIYCGLIDAGNGTDFPQLVFDNFHFYQMSAYTTLNIIRQSLLRVQALSSFILVGGEDGGENVGGQAERFRSIKVKVAELLVFLDVSTNSQQFARDVPFAPEITQLIQSIGIQAEEEDVVVDPTPPKKPKLDEKSSSIQGPQ